MSASGPETGRRRLTGRSLHPGSAEGPLLCLDEPLSFWGGVDDRGRIVDGHHPQHGTAVAGRVLAMPSGRGSSSSTAVLAELIRTGRAPAALLLGECDTILVVGALVAAELYDVSLPVVQVPGDRLTLLIDGTPVAVRAGRAPEPATVTAPQEGP